MGSEMCIRDRLALTTGEPAGIGPDLVVQLCQRERTIDWVAVGCAATLTARAQQLGMSLQLSTDLHNPTAAPGELTVLDVPCTAAVVPGELNVKNAPAVLDMLLEAAPQQFTTTFQLIWQSIRHYFQEGIRDNKQTP